MKEKIKARYRAKYSAASISNKRLDEIAARLEKKITDENEIDTKLDELNEVMPFADMAAEEHRVAELERRSKPATTPASNPQTPESTTPPADDMPAWAKALLGEVQSLKAEKEAQTVQQRLAGHDKLKTVPASFWSKRALPKDEAGIDAFVTEVETDFTALQQDLINSGLATSTKPAAGGVTNSNVDADITAWAAKGKETAK